MTDDRERCGWAEDGEVCRSDDIVKVVESHGIRDVETPKTNNRYCREHLETVREVNFRTIHAVNGQPVRTDTDRSEEGR